MICKLTKLKSNHNNLSKDEYRGYAPETPQVGGYFLLYYGTPNDSRLLRTTEIKSVQYDGSPEYWVFSTANSDYRVDIINLDEVYPRAEAV